MRLQEPEGLAEDIEAGLGELHWLYERTEPSMRLRTEGACGVGSIALAQHLREQGHEVDLVISSPRLSFDPEMRHVLTLVHDDNEELMIDLAFTQFLAYAGMSPGYVQFGGKNLFPDFKIAQVYDGNTDEYVSMMTDIAQESVAQYEAPDAWFRSIEMQGMDAGEIRAVFASIWDPAYFDVYRPTEATAAAGSKLARFILSEHAQLID